MSVSMLSHNSKTRLALLGGAVVATLLALYIVQVNALTASVWHMGDQERMVERLQKETRALEIQRVKSLSRGNMEELALQLNFVRVDEVSYVRLQPSTVASSVKQE